MYGFTFVWIIDVINVSATEYMKTMIDELEQAKDDARLAKDDAILAKDHVRLAEDDARLAKDDAAKAQGKFWIFVIENVIQTA